MACFRQATIDDLPGMLELQNLCTPRQEPFDSFSDHILSWPQLAHVAEAPNGGVVGYVLVRIVKHCDESCPVCVCEGQISSICVCDSYRRRGIATKLMNIVHEALESIYRANSVFVYLRSKSHHDALLFYGNKMRYMIQSHDKNHYSNEEDRFEMRKVLKGKDYYDDHLDHGRVAEHSMRPARRQDAVSDEEPAEAGPSSRLESRINDIMKDQLEMKPEWECCPAGVVAWENFCGLLVAGEILYEREFGKDEKPKDDCRKGKETLKDEKPEDDRRKGKETLEDEKPEDDRRKGKETLEDEKPEDDRRKGKETLKDEKPKDDRRKDKNKGLETER